MLKDNRKYLVIISTLFVLLIAIQHFVPKPIDWKPSFTATKKAPYGCYVLRDMLPELFPERTIGHNLEGFYTSSAIQNQVISNMIVIADNFSPDVYDTEKLLAYVDSGNIAFISAMNFSSGLQDSLGFKLNDPSMNLQSLLTKKKDTLLLNNSLFQIDSMYVYNKNLPDKYFGGIDTSQVKVLGTDTKNKPNFIVISYGKGQFYLHCQPLVFTNYHILYSNHRYACAALSHLPVRNVIWDTWYKPGRIINTSPVRYILSEPALQAAYYLVLLTLLLYIVFGGKRRQRVIPRYIPQKNASLGFIRTLGHLYLKNKNHADIANKKILYLKEFIRERYHLNIGTIQTDAVKPLAIKSGVDEASVQKLLDTANHIEKQQNIGTQALFALNREIESFYKNCI